VALVPEVLGVGWFVGLGVLLAGFFVGGGLGFLVVFFGWFWFFFFGIFGCLLLASFSICDII